MPANNFEPESAFLRLFGETPESWIIVHGNTHDLCIIVKRTKLKGKKEKKRTAPNATNDY